MSYLNAIILGIVQGLGEFLPISSSGHLSITEYFLGVQDVPMLFDILLHIATLIAVVLVFRKTIANLFCVLWRLITKKALPTDKNDQKMILALVVATVVTTIIGFSVKGVASKFTPLLISIFFIITGIVLLLSNFLKPEKTNSTPSIVQSLIVGFAQGVGVFPGISRSGSTIASSLFSGIDRKTAGEFSFLLSIPAILGAFILELKNADSVISTVSIGPLIVGMLTAFVVGYFSLKFLLGLINKGKLGWFAAYLIPIGVTLTLYFAVK